MTNALLGTASVGVIEGVQHIPSSTPTVEIIKIVIQVVVGLATLFKMFKKPKQEKTTDENPQI
ncbi:MAG: hypothetical protein REI96_18610 [Flavobacterium nitrogenifigens]|uniref:hypothetical protein n=1 Tax=Flavobacterium nitrogenifigens TaxID=1617283 RepID=UPI002808E68F|nr:hypothetical protein [Flavobacterium nitrogenifigens]MDQ8014467.1 hypothetical protein [Flavobacterium nitrogenifigens]